METVNFSMSMKNAWKTLSCLILVFTVAHVMAQNDSKGKGDSKTASIKVGKLTFRDFNHNGKLDPYEDYRNAIDVRAKDLLSQMNIEEKLVQLRSPLVGKTLLFRDNKVDTAKARTIFPNGIGQLFRMSDGSGNMLTFEKTPGPLELATATNDLQNFFVTRTRLGIPALFGEEGLHGLAIKDGTMFPSALGMASSWDDDLTRQAFEVVAKEARAVGANVVLAPVVDLGLDPRWGRTEETMGEDAYLAARFGLIKVNALQGNSDTPDVNHVVACVKHFGAHGQSEGGLNTAPSFVPERWLREVNFPPFEAVISEGKALMIMPNYNEINGIPTHADPTLLRNVLRKEWGFKGTVLSDYTGTNQLKDFHFVAADDTEAAIKALDAGVDLEFTEHFTYKNLAQGLESGLLTIEKIDEAVLHVLELKFRLGLFENPFVKTESSAVVGSRPHRDLALKAARESVVLLKNDNNLLPIDRKKYKKIAIIGPHADQCLLGTYSQMPKVEITPLQAIREKYKDVNIAYAQGCGLTNDLYPFTKTVLKPHEENLKLIAEAKEAAKDADIIILMVGGNANISRESVAFTGDLSNLELLGDQNELIDALKQLNKPMAAFVFSGPPISFLQLERSVSSIVQCWYLGQETGYAVAETLFGDNNPSGKLTISIPRSAGHLPAYYFAKPSVRGKGYNLESQDPLYPFGHGLSYSAFEYSNLKISNAIISPTETTTVTVDVKNVSHRDGHEIVQLYIRDKVSSVTRPIMELKDFQKVNLKAGETKSIVFNISADKLKFYGVDMKRIVEPGEFDIMVGSSSKQWNKVNLIVK